MSKELKIKGSNEPIIIDYEKYKQGSKNASLPIISACLLFETDIIVNNVPNISDIINIFKLLKKINFKYSYKNKVFIRRKNNNFNKIIFNKDFFDTRGGFYLIAALINKWKEIKIEGFGIAGCQIGERGYDNIFRIFSEFGIESKIVDNNLIIRKNSIYEGKKIVLNDLGICVSGIALILAAQYTVKTTLINIGKAPELNDLENFLEMNGVCIKINKHRHFVIYKQKENYEKINFIIQDDRIVIATYVLLTLISSGRFKIKSDKLKYLYTFINLLKNSGCNVRVNKGNKTTTITRSKKMKPLNIVIDDYPQIPTDLQPILSVFFCSIKGLSIIKDKIFPQRIFHIDQLKKMNQDITFTNNKITIKGGNKFIKNSLIGHDIRTNAAIILAACIAKGTSTIVNWEYINRGYENLLNIIQKNRQLTIK